MSRLSELRKPLQDMTAEELREHIRHIRSDRRLTKTRPAVKQARARSSGKSKDKVDKALGGLSKDQLEALLRELEGDADTGNQAG